MILTEIATWRRGAARLLAGVGGGGEGGGWGAEACRGAVLSVFLPPASALWGSQSGVQSQAQTHLTELIVDHIPDHDEATSRCVRALSP